MEGRVWTHGEGRLRIGNRVHIQGAPVAVELKVDAGAELCLGDDVVLGSGSSIEAYDRIVIGDRCRIGNRCKVLDNSLHLLRGDRRERPSSTPVIIEEDVVVEDYAVVLPGASIGRGATIGRGAVVSRMVPPGAIVRPQHVHPARLR